MIAWDKVNGGNELIGLDFLKFLPTSLSLDNERNIINWNRMSHTYLGLDANRVESSKLMGQIF